MGGITGLWQWVLGARFHVNQLRVGGPKILWVFGDYALQGKVRPYALWRVNVNFCADYTIALPDNYVEAVTRVKSLVDGIVTITSKGRVVAGFGSDAMLKQESSCVTKNWIQFYNRS